MSKRPIKACMLFWLASLPLLDAVKVVTREGKTYHGKVVLGNKGDLNVTGQDGIQSVRAGDWKEINFSPVSGQPGLTDLSFKVHQGNWKKFPDFTRVPIDQSGRMTTNAIDLAPLGSAGGQGRSYVFPVGTNLKRWDSPLVEGRSFTISTVLVTNSAPILPKEKKKMPDLIDDEVLDDILVEAVNFNELKTIRLANGTLVHLGDSEEPFTGWPTERRSNGELWSLRQYSKGKKHGLEAWWHSNGERWLENIFRNGERDGVWVEWSENGEVKARTTYNGGAKAATVRKDTEVILAQGGFIDGYALYLQDGWLNFATRVNRKLTIARSDKPLPLNRPVAVTARLFRGGTMTLTVDGRESVRVWSPGTMIRMPLDGLQVGFDENTPVGPYVGQDTRFKGTLREVRLELEGIGVTYSGKLTVTTPGSYQFNLGTDASSRLEIDGDLLIDNSDPAKPVNNWGKANLAAGVHDFRLTYAHLMPLKASGGKAESSTPREVGRLDKVWIEDNLPAGAWSQGKFDFMGAPAPVYSGAKSIKLKQGQIYFERASQPLAPAQEDLLFGYVWLDPKDPPREILMQGHDRRGW
ncbi:MAG: PA14 domain-containing protein, partial [Opitutales bacterium]